MQRSGSRPQGSSSGDTNPWDATSTIENSGYAIGGDPSRDATAALEHLIAVADPSYVDPLRHALALQLRARRDSEFTPVSVVGLAAVIGGGLPSTIDDMRAFFGDRINTLNERMHATSTDMWEAYWDGTKPRGENVCRNRLVEHISGQLPDAIRFAPEMHMLNRSAQTLPRFSAASACRLRSRGSGTPRSGSRRSISLPRVICMIGMPKAAVPILSSGSAMCRERICPPILTGWRDRRRRMTSVRCSSPGCPRSSAM